MSGDPINGIDPTGAVIESGWDVANIAIGVASLGYNVANGNVGAAALDVAGLTVDAIATAVPGVPGGAATAIRAGRVARGANTAANAAQAADNAADAASCVVNTGRNSVYWNVLADGAVEYVGITRSFASRRAHHLRKTGGRRVIDTIDGLTQLSRYDARAVEQVLIRSFGISQRFSWGTLNNLINSISPRRTGYYARATARGEEILRASGLEDLIRYVD